MKPNFIKCKFCEWKTHKWGKGSNPGKAFKRLRIHLIDNHDDKVNEEMLEMIEANEEMEAE